jgi:hypothetical protein
VTDYNNSQDAALQSTQNAKVAADTIDVLMRHLELAKSQLESVDSANHPTFCTLLYAEPGTICPLLYFHLPASETVEG